MSTDLDTTRIVRSWLRTDEHESADRVLDDVLALLDATPQRQRVRPARRFVDEKSLAKLAMAVAAVLVVAFVGTNLLPSFGSVGTLPSPLPTSATTSPTPDASSEFEPGSHILTSRNVRISMAMPAGWSGDERNIHRLPPDGWRGLLGLAVIPDEVWYVVADVCADETDVAFVQVGGPTVEDLTTPLVNQIGVLRSGPTDIMVGGYPAQKFVLRLSPECPGDQGHGIWANFARAYGFWLKPGDTGTVYVVDVDGKPLVITSQYGADASAEDIAQLEAITASIDLEPVSNPSQLAVGGASGWLPIGEHAVTVDDVPLTFSVPALVPDRGWSGYGSLSITKDTVGPQGAEALVYWKGFPNGVYPYPCANLSSLPVNASTADLAATVSTAPGTELVTGPSDVTVGGRPAKHLVLTVREDLGCDPGYFFTTDTPTGGPGWWTTDAGDEIKVWIVDVDGKRLFIAGETKPEAGSELDEEIQQIVDSIQFE